MRKRREKDINSRFSRNVNKNKKKNNNRFQKRNRSLYRISKKPSIEYMKELFGMCGLSLGGKEYEQIWEFHNLLRDKNSELDLTRIRRFEDYVIKHYVDCTIIPTMIKLPSPILDIGTGAGFPGIPLKIVSPETRIILGEPRWKRCMFMREAIDKLQLKNIEVYEHKVYGNFPEKMQGVITRAVESVTKTLKRSIDFLNLGGQVILMKGPSAEPEVIEAKREMSKYYELTKDIKYKIKNTPQRRRLLIYTKINESTAI